MRHLFWGMAGILPARDAELIQIVDSALADATARSGDWLACRPGCSQCCHGVFEISTLDALRLRDGLAGLEEADPLRAARVRLRARAAVTAYAQDFPGDSASGILGESEEEQQRFSSFANDDPCPALDPSTGTCDLYAARPLTCRIFGPPVMTAEGLGMCELCFVGAGEADVAAAEMHLAHGLLEDELVEQAQANGALAGSTIVAFALLR